MNAPTLAAAPFRLGRRDVRGAWAEYAMAAPIVAFLLLAAADLAMVLHARRQLDDAARSGAQYAALHGPDATAIANKATIATSLPVRVAVEIFSGCVLPDASLQQVRGDTCADGAPGGHYARISVSARRRPLIRFPWTDKLVDRSLPMTVAAVTRTH